MNGGWDNADRVPWRHKRLNGSGDIAIPFSGWLWLTPVKLDQFADRTAPTEVSNVVAYLSMEAVGSRRLRRTAAGLSLTGGAGMSLGTGFRGRPRNLGPTRIMGHRHSQILPTTHPAFRQQGALDLAVRQGGPSIREWPECWSSTA
jgi:hypothetical protein